MGRNRGLTNFGKTLRDLAESRDANNWTEVTERLNAAGWSGTRTTLTNWATGRYAADHAMLPYFVEAFGLTEEEQRRLAMAFAYGQGFSMASRTA